ncbi:MAG: NnrU family protein [Candidatus Thiodiazotropha endolucinida]|uniref:NnrU family protein n=1 Tax=Candidatus Thiodiazotropha taylori TaxID=2792791 RepID=A0A9E4NPF0_9GAMM|nr:NnrU family protein [Candidatus Thiodiazotropha taylori]MCW4238435.1 NnrU family protein [Candidatus Thiodiazotropha endolucinida]
MTLLLIGLTLWAGVHLFPSLLPQVRDGLIKRIGDGPYQGLFALLILTGVVLIVFGWRGTVPTQVYAPPAGLRHAAMLLVVIGFILMAAASFPRTRVKRLIRHPQLTGVLLWALAHLLANGDSRSLLLFSVMAIWTVTSMLLINRRDGDWVKPETTMAWYGELLVVVTGVGVAVLILRFHYHIAGVALIGG